MQHLGDVCQINGAQIEPVDVIISGSPCQDLSVAGKRTGLAGERSGLFMEQIRIIKEMRAADETKGRAAKFIRPRFMVWENVPGALSSNSGKDFRIILEETAKIIQPDAVIPRPAGGKWRNSGCILGRGWSIAWRILDARFWGVPQHRRRIALVADFGGGAAPEILFERKSLLGDFEPGGKERQSLAAGIGGGSKEPDIICLNDQGGQSMNVSVNVTGTLRAQGHGHQPIIAAGFNYRVGGKAGNIGYQAECAPSLASRERSGQNQAAVLSGKSVRRLTPLECERLQGYPDGWTDIDAWVDSKGKLHKESSDTARCRALGNSIALPPWRWVLLRLAAQYYRPATMGSLFDGIGGFPLLWESINGKDSCRWASEIDEFCIAVTKRRFEE